MKELEGKINIRYCDSKYLDLIDLEEVDIVFECGSRDALDAIRIDKVYQPKQIYVFEPNPEGIDKCRKHLTTYNKDHINFFETAVSDVDGTVDFYPTTKENIGASSMFEYNSRANGWDGYKNNCFKSTQKGKISVPSVRLDTFMRDKKIKKIDLLCMDVQEAELLVLKGLGELLGSVKHIILEVSGDGYYKNGARYHEIKSFLESHNFKLRCISDGAVRRFGDALFSRKEDSNE